MLTDHMQESKQEEMGWGGAGEGLEGSSQAKHKWRAGAGSMPHSPACHSWSEIGKWGAGEKETGQ